MDSVMKQSLTLEFLYAIGVVISLSALLWFFSRLLRSYREKDSKGVAIAALFIAVSGYGAWYSAAPFIPSSSKTIDRDAFYNGTEKSCRTSPRYKDDCGPNGGCMQCMSRSGCLEAIHNYYYGCFSALYTPLNSGEERLDFLARLNSCMNEKSGCQYFGKLPTGE